MSDATGHIMVTGSDIIGYIAVIRNDKIGYIMAIMRGDKIGYIKGIRMCLNFKKMLASSITLFRYKV
jgi:hypothetical protein